MPERRIGIFSQLVPPTPKWTADKVPNQTGKVAIITGGHVGVGKETARMLLSKGSKVYIATLDDEKAHQAIDELKADTGKDSIFLLHLDLANLDSIKEAADEFRKEESQLHTLYNNESVTRALSERETVQGFDYMFGTNVLGHFYFTKLLLPVLTNTAEKAPAGSVRVVNISSLAHYISASEGIRWPTIGPGVDAPVARRKLGMTRVYGQSKLGNILFSNELARRYKDSNIVSISLFSGVVDSDVKGHAGSFFQRLQKIVGACICFLISGGDLEALTEDILDREQKVEDAVETRVADTERRVGAAARRRLDPLGLTDETASEHQDPAKPTKVIHRAITPLYAGTAPEAGRLNGRYLTAWARITLPSKNALNGRLAAKLWDWCEDRIKEHNKEDTKAAAAKETIEVGEVTRPEEVTRSEEVPKEVTKSEEVPKPKEDTKPEADTKPKEDTKPEADTKPKEDTTPEVDTKPKEDAKPEEDTKPKEDAKVKEDVKPEEDTKAKEDTEAKA